MAALNLEKRPLIKIKQIDTNQYSYFSKIIRLQGFNHNKYKVLFDFMYSY